MFEITPEFLKQRWLMKANNRLPYNPNLKERVRELRKNMTEAEKKLWHQFLQPLAQKSPPQSPSAEGEANSSIWVSRGRRFRVYRQRAIDNFIVDFYIPEYNLIIELDGDSHYEDGAPEYDAERTEILEWYGLTIIRFTNDEVYHNFEGVCMRIEESLINP